MKGPLRGVLVVAALVLVTWTLWRAPPPPTSSTTTTAAAGRGGGGGATTAATATATTTAAPCVAADPACHGVCPCPAPRPSVSAHYVCVWGGAHCAQGRCRCCRGLTCSSTCPSRAGRRSASWRSCPRTAARPLSATGTTRLTHASLARCVRKTLCLVTSSGACIAISTSRAHT
jgi:hypothetical protein